MVDKNTPEKDPMDDLVVQELLEKKHLNVDDVDNKSDKVQET
jgi:hypothetical protein